MTALDQSWLARPIAHRGLHDAAKGVIENTISAARAAIAAGYGIECDVQGTKDGDIVVFHDDKLDRLTECVGRVKERTTAELTRIALRGADEFIPRFCDFLDTISGRVALIVEIKSDFDGDMTTTRRVGEILARYDGPVVIESFDPDPIAFLRAQAKMLGVSHIQLGFVGEARYDYDEWTSLPEDKRAQMTHFLHIERTRPDFLSWNVADLPHAIPALFRNGMRLPVTTWTVRSGGQAASALKWADQIVFEGFAP